MNTKEVKNVVASVLAKLRNSSCRALNLSS